MGSWDDLERIHLSPNPVNTPSWSWLAYDHFFDPGTRDFNIKFFQNADLASGISILDVHIDLAGPNIFGRINRSAITISGKLVVVSSRSMRKSKRKKGNWKYPMWNVQFHGRSTYCCEPDWLPRGRIPDIPPGLCLLKTASHPAYELPRGRARQACWGLLLIPTRIPGEYRRVGAFSTSRHARTTYDPFQDCEFQTIRLV